MSWKRKNSNIFIMDIDLARSKAKEGIFLHMEKSDRRMVFWKRSSIIFILFATNTVQYQLLEAILEEIAGQFFESYKEICENPTVMSSMRNAFGGFQQFIPEIIENTQKEKITWVEARCAICKKKVNLCIKNSLIENSTRFPISVVHIHEGHGLLVYLDGHFRVRGQEVVEITG